MRSPSMNLGAIGIVIAVQYEGKVGGGATQGTWRGSRPEALTPKDGAPKLSFLLLLGDL